VARIIEKYSFGLGDRFAHQAAAQLDAVKKINEAGVEVVPVWNKSNREHMTIGSVPQSARDAADQACQDLNWAQSHYVDADHINLKIVDPFLTNSDFFTLDVADAIGSAASDEEIAVFVSSVSDLIGTHQIQGIDSPIVISESDVANAARKFLKAAQSAGEIYRYILEKKGEDNFVTEVSMDETDSPQTPTELLIILAAIAKNEIPIQTIAPKFTGRFNKGVDYVGDVVKFEQEFSDDLAVIKLAIAKYGLPENLKLSVHSGSDKFSIYGAISRCLKETGAGIHVKTAGTTWLEELIGLAEADGEALDMAKEIYAKAYAKRDALCEPYATVIDIDESKLPSPEQVAGWTSAQYQNALRHVQSNAEFNPSFRQLLHVGYKVAAQKGDEFLQLLKKYESTIARNVTENLFDRHLKPLFLDDQSA
jgi:hypothetical protein